MTITGIEKRKKSLSALYIDGEHAVDINTETIFKYKLSVGMQITDDELLSLIEESNFTRAKNKALWLISQRDYSSKELIDKLMKETDYESAEAAAERMKELGLINDEKYAEKLAETLFKTKHMAKNAVYRKLIEKGIQKDLAEDISEKLSLDPCEQIRILIDKKYFKNMFDDKGRKRTISALIRLGYEYSDIRSSFIEFDEENEESLWQ